MYKTGHWGGALLLYAPLGAGLLFAGWPAAALAGGAVVLALARLPDYDQRVPLVSHRGSTHTLAFALLVGLGCGGAGLALARNLAPTRALAVGTFGFVVGVVAIVSHLLADALTPAGITPFWPLSSRHVSLNVVRADNVVANYALLSLGVFVTAAILALAGSI